MSKYILIAITFLTILSCRRHHASENPIDRVTIQLTANGTQTEATWNDTDGPGGQNPTIDTIYLSASTLYQGMIKVYSQSKEVTPEIESLKNMHRFFYIPAHDSIIINPTDLDDNGLPVGLKYSLKSSDRSLIMSLRVLLSHYDGVTKTNNPSTDLDIDISFPVRIK